MEAVKASVASLKKAASKSPIDKKIRAHIDHISSFLVLLDSTLPSSESIARLIHVLRTPFVSLYVALLDHALPVAASIFHLLCTKLNTAMVNTDGNVLGAWGEVQRSIISGVMSEQDFLENATEDKARIAVAAAFSRHICDFYLPKSGPECIASISASLKCTAYGLLEDLSTASCVAHDLRDPNLLGGQRLGLTLLQTNDYLTFETLLNLFVRMLPSVKSDLGPAKRSQFIRDVFISALPSHVQMGKEIVLILEKISSSDWEVTAMKIVEAVAKSRITFAQPFKVLEIRTETRTFPQAGPLDMLYVDPTSFLVNVDEPGGGAYDVLRVPFANVLGIHVSRARDTTSHLVVVKLSQPAILGDAPLTPSGDGKAATLSFEIHDQDRKLFMKVLEDRGLEHVAQSRNPLSFKVSLPSAPIALPSVQGDNLTASQARLNTSLTDLILDNEADMPEPEIKAAPLASGRIQTGQTGNERKQRAQVPAAVGPQEPFKSGPKEQPSSVKANTPTQQPSAADAVDLAGDIASNHENASAPKSPPASLGTNTTNGQNLSSAKGCSKTGSQKQVEAIFGATDDELSEVSEAESVVEISQPPRARSSRKPQPAAGAPRSKARRVLDSGDEQKSTFPPRKDIRKKKKAYALDSPSVSEVFPVAATVLSSSSPSVRASRRLSESKMSRASAPSTITSLDGPPAMPNRRTCNSRQSSVATDAPVPIVAQPKKGKAVKKVTHREPANRSKTPDPTIESTKKKTHCQRDASVTPTAPIELPNITAEVMPGIFPVDKPNDCAPAPTEDAAKQASTKKATRVAPKFQRPATPAIRAQASRKRKREDRDDSESPPGFTLDSRRPSVKKTRLSDGATPKKRRTPVPSTTPDVPRRNGKKVRTGRSPSIEVVREAKIALPVSKRSKASHNRPHIDNDHVLAGENVAPIMATTLSKRHVEPGTEMTLDSRQVPIGISSGTRSLQQDRGQGSPKRDNTPTNDEKGLDSAILEEDERPTGEALEHNPANAILPEVTIESADGESRDANVVTDKTAIEYEDFLIPTKMGSSPAFRHPPLDSNGTMRASKGKKHSPLPNPFMHSAAHDNTPTPKVASFNTHVCSPPLPLNRSKKLLFPPPSKLVPSLHDAAKSPVKKERHSTFSNQADAGFRPDHFRKGMHFPSEPSKTRDPDVPPKLKPKSNQKTIQDQILHALSEINAVVINNMDRKIERIVRDVRVTRDTILSEGGLDLMEMRLKRIEHYNALVDLEHNYAMHRQKFVNNFEEIHKIGQEAVKTVEQIVKSHDRNSLSREFPASLLPKTIPSILTGEMF